jgi:DNA (cytosine-5)-methyltransferase 1
MDVIPINMQAACKNGAKSPNMLGIGNPGDPAHTVNASDQHAVAHTLNGCVGGNQIERDYIPEVAYALQERDSKGSDSKGSDSNTKDGHLIPMQVQWASGGGQVENPTMQALRSGAEHNYQFLRHGMAVRRLTPKECCRLQGFPDDYLDIVYRGKPACDGPKYRALGNSMAVPVIQWVGEKIEKVEQLAQASLIMAK